MRPLAKIIVTGAGAHRAAHALECGKRGKEIATSQADDLCVPWNQRFYLGDVPTRRAHHSADKSLHHDPTRQSSFHRSGADYSIRRWFHESDGGIFEGFAPGRRVRQRVPSRGVVRATFCWLQRLACSFCRRRFHSWYKRDSNDAKHLPCLRGVQGESRKPDTLSTPSRGATLDMLLWLCRTEHKIAAKACAGQSASHKWGRLPCFSSCV